MENSDSPIAPFVFDIRGGGLFWGVEFDFTVPEASRYDFKGQRYAMLLQAQALQNGMVILGFTGCANVAGTAGEHVMLSPAYNITADEVEKIVDILARSADEVLNTYLC